MNRSRTLSLTILIILGLSAALCAQSNGGFESGLSSWTSTPSGRATVETIPSFGFPSEGNQFVSILGAGDDAAAGHGPHSGGFGLGQAAVFSRGFVRPDGENCEVRIDWDFFLREVPLNTAFNDFFSIDILDDMTGTLLVNMVFIDNGLLAGTPAYSSIPGAGTGVLRYVPALFPQTTFSEHLPSGFKRASASLPLGMTTEGQQLRITITVGNGGDSVSNSLAYVDNFRVLSGGFNLNSQGSLRVLGAAHQDGVLGSGDGGSNANRMGPIDFEVRPGQRISIRHSKSTAGTAFALLAGSILNDGSQFGFGDVNLSVAAGIAVIIDGINPATPADALLGTMSAQANFLDATIPIGSLPGEFGLQSVFASPTAQFGITITTATRVAIKAGAGIRVGDTAVVESDGSPLQSDGSGTIDLSGMSGGGFTFYGTLYTDCYLNTNGNITFGSPSSDFNSTLEEFYGDQPRIAPMWEDFGSPSTGIAIGDFRVTTGSDVTVISWGGLSELEAALPGNSFSAALHSDGSIVIAYDSLTSQSGVVGISPGGLMPPTSQFSTVDFSNPSYHAGNSSFESSANPIVQIFERPGDVISTSDKVDIMTLGRNGPNRITFSPEVNGYRVFVGTQ